jgi:hypothetical protein
MRSLAPLAALLAVLLLPAAAGAQGADVEGVWSFSGGEIAVQAEGDGTFTGTVIRRTQLANCPHPVGEKMWVAMRPQPDGQYWGGHQWFNNADCSPIAQRGPTAYRVLQRPDGARFLRVCFGRHDRPEQPKIAPDGSSSDVTDECRDSDLLRPLPTTAPTVKSVATLPSQGRRGCLSKRSFRIRLKQPPGDALATATVSVNGKRVAIRRGERITAGISLRGLPRGRYTVKLTATTVLGRRISGTRRYRTCAPKQRRSSRGPL